MKRVLIVLAVVCAVFIPRSIALTVDRTETAAQPTTKDANVKLIAKSDQPGIGRTSPGHTSAQSNSGNAATPKRMGDVAFTQFGVPVTAEPGGLLLMGTGMLLGATALRKFLRTVNR